ncbi:hypothetical protein [Sphingomonas flavalba]|nr:hypothetical protein [Sphingomonas flavalba]
MSTLLAIVVGLIVFVLLLKAVFWLVAVAIGLVLAIAAYFLAEKLIGSGR